MEVFGRPAAALLMLLSLGACDEDGETSDPPEHTDVPAEIEGCPDETGLVAIGESRVCTCDDGSEAEQTCLSTGTYAECKCEGGGW